MRCQMVVCIVYGLYKLKSVISRTADMLRCFYVVVEEGVEMMQTAGFYLDVSINKTLPVDTSPSITDRIIETMVITWREI